MHARLNTRALVVDDHPDLADTVAMMLRPHVETVYVAYGAAEALALAAEHAPELVVADLAMPSMDGLELARELRRLPALAGSYFLALTAFEPDKYRAATRIAGFDEHLVKPVTEAQLLGVLDALPAAREARA